jgi:hypothetical protein
MFKSIISIIVLILLAGCQNLGYSNMTAEQIRATNGTSTCTSINTIYGKQSMIAINEQDVKKGSTSKGKLSITCGDALMSIESDIGVPVPPGAVTTTTTTVIPANVAAPSAIQVVPATINVK